MSKRLANGLIAALVAVLVVTLGAQNITIPNTFVNGTVADADQVNANFNALSSNALNRSAGIMNGTLTFTPDNTRDIGASGATRPRDLFLGRHAVVGGDVTTVGSSSVGGNFGVTGTSTLVGAVAAANTLAVTGVATFGGAVRAVQITRTGSSAGMQLLSQGGTGKGYGLISDTGGNFFIQDDADADPQLSYSTSAVATLFATGGIVMFSPTFLSSGELHTGFLTPPQITASQNNYSPTGLFTASGLPAVRILRLATDASRALTGIQAGPNGTRLTLQNEGAFNLVLQHEVGTSAVQNRILTPGGVDFTIRPLGGVEIFYDSVASGTGRWLLVSP